MVNDASCNTDRGICLNDIQLLGPKLQRDLHETVMRLRRHKVAVCPDIKKMFNQVRVNKEQWNLLRILWKEDQNAPLREYYFTVVPFGLTASAHLAVRSMIQAAREAKNEFPVAANVIEEDFYMDDCSTGADSDKEAIKLMTDVKNILNGAGF
ncbi:MAG: hypothetical protein EOP45_09265 [Sphingobacteriaceae bacterium]|nr:MAG: hypothetical protein EOP45_09265 [Sphingobacteriaceae bacterium]